jgi:hypothetical protein
MGTLAELKTRIASDLTRDDLTSQIANVVADSIKFYARERFWFNQTRTKTFSTVIGQVDYGAPALDIIPNIVRIDALFLPQNQSIYPLDRYEPADFEVIAGGMTGGGKPTAYTYVDQAIRLWPAPMAVYTMRLHCFYKLPYPNDGDTNAWTDDAEELVRAHAKMLLYMDVLEDDQNAQRMAAKIPALLDGLRSETSARMATGRIKGTDF